MHRNEMFVTQDYFIPRGIFLSLSSSPPPLSNEQKDIPSSAHTQPLLQKAQSWSEVSSKNVSFLPFYPK